MQKNNSKILSRSGHHSETFAAFGLFVGQKSPNWQFLGMKKFSLVIFCHSVLQQCRNTEKSTNITCIHRIFWWMCKKTGWSDRELIRLQKNNATTTGPVLFNNRQFHIFFAAQCIWAYFGCGARHDEATCKQRFDDCVSGESCKYKLDFYLCIV